MASEGNDPPAAGGALPVGIALPASFPCPICGIGVMALREDPEDESLYYYCPTCGATAFP